MVFELKVDIEQPHSTPITVSLQIADCLNPQNLLFQVNFQERLTTAPRNFKFDKEGANLYEIIRGEDKPIVFVLPDEQLFAGLKANSLAEIIKSLTRGLQILFTAMKEQGILKAQ